MLQHPTEGKFAGFGLDVDVGAWRAEFEREVAGRTDRGFVVAAWLRSFFAAWHGGPSVGDRSIVGHCPVLALDWDLVLADLPDAEMMHVVRSPFAVFGDTKQRRPGWRAEGFAERWSLVNAVAALHAVRRPDRFRIVHYETLVRDPGTAMAELAAWLGIEFDGALLAATWNGRPLRCMGPFGGIACRSAEHDRGNIDALDPVDRGVLATWTSATRALYSIDDPPPPDARANFLDAADNLVLSRIATKQVPAPLEHETAGDFWGRLDDLGVGDR